MFRLLVRLPGSVLVQSSANTVVGHVIYIIYVQEGMDWVFAANSRLGFCMPLRVFISLSAMIYQFSSTVVLMYGNVLDAL